MRAPCNCYVAALPPQERFAVRYGAHEAACPSYRPSRDPVDRANDEDARRQADDPIETEVAFLEGIFEAYGI